MSYSADACYSACKSFLSDVTTICHTKSIGTLKCLFQYTNSLLGLVFQGAFKYLIFN